MFDATVAARLLEPVAGDQPCGPDLEYDPALIELQTLAAGKPEQQFGDKIIPGEEPDWPAVGAAATALLGRTKDLRVATLLVRSTTRVDGVAGLVAALGWMDQLLQNFWPQLHPALDADDNDDPTMRVSALQTLADATMLVADFREARVVSVRGIGPLKVRDFEAALGGASARAGEQALTQEQLTGVLREVLEQQPAALDHAVAALGAVTALQETFNRMCGRGDLLDLTLLRRPAHVLSQVCRPLLSGAGAQAASDTAADEHQGGDAAPAARVASASVAAPGLIASRDDAVRALDKVIDYLRKAEPSNPAPLLIERAKRLIGADFMAIMADLAPDAVGTVEHISGRRNDDR